MYHSQYFKCEPYDFWLVAAITSDYRRAEHYRSKSSSLCHRDDQFAVYTRSYLHTRDRALCVFTINTTCPQLVQSKVDGSKQKGGRVGMSAFCVLFDLFIECFYFDRVFGTLWEVCHEWLIFYDDGIMADYPQCNYFYFFINLNKNY